jgi:D-beta-D-heptose 7-phosphate kinase / D-beta-D-heptose 1-phosphate adenosyltransferase
VIEHLTEVINEIEHGWITKRVLVVGDVMLDKYIWGDVARISPEAPVPVVRVDHRGEQPGGAANVAMNLAKLGAQTILIGFSGADDDGALLHEKLTSNDVTPVFIACNGFPTVSKTRILCGHQQMLRLDTERLVERDSRDHERLAQSAISHLPGCHAVVLSDYAKGALAPGVCRELIQAARSLGIPILVDPKNPDFTRYSGATSICPNLGEISQALHMNAFGIEALQSKAQLMVKTFDLEFLTVTLSEKGIALLRPDNCFIAPAVSRQVFDVSGAGDTVIAVLALSLASQFTPEVGVQLANLAAGVVVGKVGTVPVERRELLAALSPEIALHAVEKLMTRSELLSRIAWWRANGERVVFTNGCFDLLHKGHVTVLEQARRFGDRLIVAVNSDASVRELKGPTRPITGENERAHVLAAMASVDAVVIFGEATPLELIMALKPDVIVKGGDYDPRTVVGAREVQAWGGQVRIVPLVEGFSTTSLIAKGAGN